MEDFRTKLKDLSPDFYQEIEEVFARHGIEDVEITTIGITPRFEITSKRECEELGGKWVCYNRPNKPPRCQCQGARRPD